MPIFRPTQREYAHRRRRIAVLSSFFDHLEPHATEATFPVVFFVKWSESGAGPIATQFYRERLVSLPTVIAKAPPQPWTIPLGR